MSEESEAWFVRSRSESGHPGSWALEARVAIGSYALEASGHPGSYALLEWPSGSYALEASGHPGSYALEVSGHLVRSSRSESGHPGSYALEARVYPVRTL
jgi:hypothetical protein